MSASPTAMSESSTPSVPRHVAIIMDGNGRWAKAKGLPRKMGHQRGADALKKLLDGCHDAGIEFVTVYAFSSENWNREPDEVSDLMELMRFYLRREVKNLHRHQVRLHFIGDRSQLSEDIRTELQSAEELTAHNSGLKLTVALSYGSRQELMRTIRTIAVKVANGSLRPEEIDDYTILAHLDTARLPDPDLLIRTGGEQRLSNFLLWQSAYTELYFTDVLWPDFTAEHLNAAIADYQARERRFGGRNA